MVGEADDAEGALGGAFPPPPPPIEEPFPPAPLDEEIFPSPPPPVVEEGGPEAPSQLPSQVGGPGGAARAVTSPGKEKEGPLPPIWRHLCPPRGRGGGGELGWGALTPAPVAQGEGEQH